MNGQPNIDTPLACGLTPGEIIAAVIRDPHQSGAAFVTSIDPSTFDIINAVSNARTGFSVRVGYREETITQPDNNTELLGTYLCELQIGTVFVYGVWNISITFGGESELEWAKNKADEAFLRGATLIGKRTERQIVVFD